MGGHTPAGDAKASKEYLRSSDSLCQQQHMPAMHEKIKSKYMKYFIPKESDKPQPHLHEIRLRIILLCVDTSNC